jgi:hypothetical protein
LFRPEVRFERSYDARQPTTTGTRRTNLHWLATSSGSSEPKIADMTPSTFIALAVTLRLARYMFDSRSRLFVVIVAITCTLGSAHGFLQGAWPLGFLEAFRSLIAARRLRRARREY